MCVERFEWQECNMCGGVGMAGIQCDWKDLGMARMRGGGGDKNAVSVEGLGRQECNVCGAV